MVGGIDVPQSGNGWNAAMRGMETGSGDGQYAPVGSALGVHQSLPCVKGGAAHIGRRRDCSPEVSISERLPIMSCQIAERCGKRLCAVQQSPTPFGGAPFTQRGLCTVQNCLPFPFSAQARYSIQLIFVHSSPSLPLRNSRPVIYTPAPLSPEEVMSTLPALPVSFATPVFVT